ncbi:hypothetical protein J6Y50_06795 [bacterium]|nr:hypothetical protein [bacterium]
MNTNERKNVISSLKNLADTVRDLKNNHRQKRPIIIEFSGSPKAGKTSCINSLELFLRRNDFKVQIIQERASVCPVTDKQSPMFNYWTALMSLSGLIGTLENKKNDIDFLILDRGVFDSLCWFEWLVNTEKMEENDRDATEKFLLLDKFVKSIDIVFAFTVTPEKSIEREYAHLLTDKKGSIMNKKVLSQYSEAIRNTVEKKKEYFNVLEIDTSKKDQDQVGKEVTELTLKTLKDMLMERIGYFPKNEEIKDIFADKNVISFSEIKDKIPNISFDFRDIIEKNNEFIQPISVAIFLSKNKDKILVIKKNKNATSPDSPEKGKDLIYIGGHSRLEDKTGSNTNDFLSICKATLKREINEEIGISIALDRVNPVCLYTKSDDKSKQHMAICFILNIDEEIKLRLDPQELVQAKGTSKSGKFIPINEITMDSLEDWSRTIIRDVLKLNINQGEQLKLPQIG